MFQYFRELKAVLESISSDLAVIRYILRKSMRQDDRGNIYISTKQFDNNSTPEL